MVTVGTNNKATRDAWVEKTLKAIPSGLRILDAGAGEQTYKSICGHLEYVAQDFGQYDGKGDEKGLQMGSWDQANLDIISDITSIPEPDESFDAVMCTEVFEHLPKPISAIQEFSRLLKQGGLLIVTAPFCSMTHFAPYHFYTGFNRYFYQMHLEENGFEIIEIKSNGNFFEYMGQEIRRIPSIADKYSNNKPNRLEQLAIGFVLRMLERFSKEDKGSHELLCFGFHILAKKR